jgi:hypothetical protein
MADRFNGNIHIGGRITQEHFKLAEPLLEGDFEDGQGEFCNCVSEDFADLVQYCEEHKIALKLQWDGKYEYGAMCEYWISGNYKQYDTDSGYRIVIPIEYMDEKAKEAPKMTILDFIEGLDIPVFPEFSIGEPEPAVELLPADKPRYLTPAGVECTIIRENDVYALNDVWVYDRNGEWIKTVGYRHETVQR